ncbi:LOW QUALITY PROTEIN: uncharacterized protein LOC130621837 [Hydractinia symbiolongicarpus]|uniref:LOW QUALITY PROTEIN: uncharacterized protein LOC130621837 n=1 Tax=Hydractinia symbiolongicarpus TaxID=13093 RepID=UPI00254E37AF|nr:LOW QUALITY PROTEIN: uncharacterized protein LOC130621837 [Hydractinia symbiolongicarpus]
MKAVVITRVFIILTQSLLYAQPYKECHPDKKTCEYWLVVKEKLTMIYKKDLVYAADGKLYKYDEHPSNYTTEVPVDQVVTVDGVNRMVIAVNETIPGPALVVYEDQILIIHVKNLLLSDAVTIHWHGLHQKDTPFMDGVGYITQCPIGAGQTFSYRFKASPKGTFWYHSHVGAQRTNGVFGAFIIKEKPKAGVKPPEDMIMTVMDWHHHSSEEVYIKMVYGNFIGRKKYQTTKTLDGGMFSGVPWVSGLIEGKGRYMDPKTGKTIEAPLTKYKVKQGQSYRFRVIHTGTIYPLRISVDQHDLTVMASDGYDLKPRVVESFIINPGERFDFLLKADKSDGNYWIRANSMEADVANHTAKAILHYDGATDVEPSTTRRQCTNASSCDVINCPFRYFPKRYYINCHLISDLQQKTEDDPAPEFRDDSEEHFLNFAFPGTTVTPGAVNGRKFEFPGVNSLTQTNDIGDYDCDKHDCGEDKVCYCHYELKIPFNKTIQMIWLNVGSRGWVGSSHPFAWPQFLCIKNGVCGKNRTTGKLLEKGRLKSPDIACDGVKNFCNDAKWKNKTWKNGNVPGLNLKNPPRKDTLIIPTGGYAVVRIRSDNPGKWFMHCHIEVHALDGMAMVLKEAEEKFPTPPKGFPICQNFYDDQSRNINYLPEKGTAKNDDCKYDTKIIAVAVALAVLVAIQLVVIVLLCCKKSETKSHDDVSMHYRNNNTKK